MKDTSPSPDARVTLHQVTSETVRTICELKVFDNQKHLVTPNAMRAPTYDFGLAGLAFRPHLGRKQWWLVGNSTPVYYWRSLYNIIQPN